MASAITASMWALQALLVKRQSRGVGLTIAFKRFGTHQRAPHDRLGGRRVPRGIELGCSYLG